MNTKFYLLQIGQNSTKVLAVSLQFRTLSWACYDAKGHSALSPVRLVLEDSSKHSLMLFLVVVSLQLGSVI